MNKVVTSVGLMALSAAALHAYDPEFTRARTGRPFTVSAAVRGFYDDNPTQSPDKLPVGVVTTPSGATQLKFLRPQDSLGFEVTPSVHVNLPLEQTFIRAGYIYSLRYFENREPDNIDMSHEFNALLRHAFSPRHDITVGDSFVVSREPTVVDKTGIITAPTRSNSDAYHNHGYINYNAQLTDLWSVGVGYANDWYDYSAKGLGSRSALLDRLEHSPHADLRYQITPAWIGLIGYQLGLVNYTADEYIYTSPLDVEATLLANGVPPDQAHKRAFARSDIRDSISHFVYLGVDHDFTHKLRGSIRGGAQITDYVNTHESAVSPYADASLTYVYLPSSSVTVGVRHQRVATDVVSNDAKGHPTLDQEATAGYVQFLHQFTPDFTGSLLLQAQHATFNDGAADSESDNLYLIGLNLSYRIDRHWSIEAGYNYDMVDSDLTIGPILGKTYDARSFSRNRVYLGVRASY